MMAVKILETDTDYGRIQYEITEEYAVASGYRGKDMSVTIPEQVADKPVTIIGKKAFLGAKSLQTLFLPESIITIQDWAFASCSSLEKMTLPRKKLNIGQGILKDCVSLKQIVTAGEFSQDADVSYLLAAVMNKLDAFYLFDAAAAGSAEWLKQWDMRMLSLMEKEDADGFSKMLLCGEEDYGSRENNLDYYMEQKRRSKVRLAMLRLMHDICLKDDVRKKLLSYLQSHKKGERFEETWRVVLEEHGDEKEYYQFLLDNECITNENMNAVLEDMGGQHTEMKAFLMHWQSGRISGEDAFAGLEW
ncbi:MAG: leucine-rich repeat domain-containing protein [Clostridium sp.]|nr:leucine-rich repeat domain-containing protein [Clostridium sp.]